MEGDGEFLDRQPDHEGDISMSNDDDGLLHPQPDQDDIYRALVMMAVRSYTHGGFYSPAGADDQAGMLSEYHYAFGLAGGGASRPRARAFPGHPFPVRAPAAAAVMSEAAIAALEAAEAPADDCCPVCLQDGAAPAAWSRVAPCGHRFHAACAEKWLRVKPSCPVCRRPAAPAPPAAVPGVMN
ncbi:hypothetical protein C2845_PM10G02440 [Panicum miliaceum]|uniref:RING-type domain-containing protein n=1 Tax=Panicum miliaceum TaxID=4540 RepID=A0A3L6PCH6_PANMI|nr:hypothetical protein C2845_PM10G02440 [Panicum miliaceum]